MHIIRSLVFIASLAFTSCEKKPEPPDTSQSKSHIKELHLALFEYDNQFGGYPDNLKQLVDKGIIQQNLLDSCIAENITYVPGKTSLRGTHEIILYPPPIDGEYVFMRIDGSAENMPEAEFLELLEAQTSK